MLSNLRRTVLAQLAKAWRLGLDVPAGRLVRVFNFNGLLTYRFLRELESEGVVERTGRGMWRLRESSKARAIVDYALELWIEECRRRVTYTYLCENLPDVYYYKPDLPEPWFGGVEYILVVADPVLKDKVSPPGNYNFIYTPLRGREFRFSYNLLVTIGEREQSIADFLSYDPYWDVELYLFWYYGDYDLDEVARKCTVQGLKRLSSFLSFMRMAVGKSLATSFDYVKLLDEEVYKQYVPKYFTWVFANRVAERRGI